MLRRARTEIVGTLRQEGHVRVVIPDDPRLFRDVVVAQGDEGGAREDDKVAVRITVWPTRHISPAGEIVAVFGPRGQLEAERLSVVREFNLRMDFPPEVARAAEALPQHVAPSDLAGRQDLTGETIFTIDPPDARDFDDAVSLRRIADGGWELGVHIADVSHYVPPDGAIDLEARARGTSVYLPGQVLPMLPEKLSNGLCSLRPHEIRLTKTVRMKFSADGNLRGAEIFPSFIRSVRRFNYDEVQAVLDGGRLPEGEEPLAALLRTMNELAELLRQERRARGMLEMDIPEAHILTDEKGRTIGVELRRGNASHRLIEQFMLAANEAVANYLLKHNLPYLARAHDEPEEKAIDEFRDMARALGHTLPSPGTRQQIQRFLARTAGKPEAAVLNYLLLRSMKIATYVAEDKPHYAIAAPHYLHFTSPIRRYPDLLAHRILQESWSGRLRDSGAPRLVDAEPAGLDDARDGDGADRRRGRARDHHAAAAGVRLAAEGADEGAHHRRGELRAARAGLRLPARRHRADVVASRTGTTASTASAARSPAPAAASTKSARPSPSESSATIRSSTRLSLKCRMKSEQAGVRGLT